MFKSDTLSLSYLYLIILLWHLLCTLLCSPACLHRWKHTAVTTRLALQWSSQQHERGLVPVLSWKQQHSLLPVTGHGQQPDRHENRWAMMNSPYHQGIVWLGQHKKMTIILKTPFYICTCNFLRKRETIVARFFFFCFMYQIIGNYNSWGLF